MGNIIVTTVGRDRPGIVAGISHILQKYNANIIKTRASALGKLFVMVMLVDVSKLNVEPQKLTSALKSKGTELGSGISIEDEDVYRKCKKLVAFDLDGTLINMEIINELGKLAGSGKEIREITHAAMEGKINFEEALTRRVKLLKGLPLEKLGELMRKAKLNPGALDLVKELKRAGFIVAIITGGFDFYANHIGKLLGVNYICANRLVIKDGKLTGEYEGKIVSPRSKLEALMKIARRENLSLSRCVAIGDGANDLLLLKKSGLGIGYRPKMTVKRQVDALINDRNLGAAMALIGSGELGKDIIRKLKPK